MKTAFEHAHGAVNEALLAQAVQDKNYRMAEEAVSPAITMMRSRLMLNYKPLTALILTEAADEAVSTLNAAMRFARKTTSSIGKVSFEFDARSQPTLAWLQTYNFQFLDDLSATTIENIREILTALFDQEITFQQATKEIAAAIGDKDRALLIARTESNTIANAGKRLAWQQAQDDGLLGAKTERAWVSHEGSCPICQGLDGTTVLLKGGQYTLPSGKKIDGPPAHPRCTCTEKLRIH